MQTTEINHVAISDERTAHASHRMYHPTLSEQTLLECTSPETAGTLRDLDHALRQWRSLVLTMRACVSMGRIANHASGDRRGRKPANGNAPPKESADCALTAMDNLVGAMTRMQTPSDENLLTCRQALVALDRMTLTPATADLLFWGAVETADLEYDDVVHTALVPALTASAIPPCAPVPLVEQAVSLDLPAGLDTPFVAHAGNWLTGPRSLSNPLGTGWFGSIVQMPTVYGPASDHPSVWSHTRSVIEARLYALAKGASGPRIPWATMQGSPISAKRASPARCMTLPLWALREGHLRSEALAVWQALVPDPLRTLAEKTRDKSWVASGDMHYDPTPLRWVTLAWMTGHLACATDAETRPDFLPWLADSYGGLPGDTMPLYTPGGPLPCPDEGVLDEMRMLLGLPDPVHKFARTPAGDLLPQKIKRKVGRPRRGLGNKFRLQDKDPSLAPVVRGPRACPADMELAYDDAACAAVVAIPALMGLGYSMLRADPRMSPRAQALVTVWLVQACQETGTTPADMRKMAMNYLSWVRGRRSVVLRRWARVIET